MLFFVALLFRLYLRAARRFAIRLGLALLRQRARFEMLDFSYHVLNVDAVDRAAKRSEGAGAKKKKAAVGAVDASLQQDTDFFLACAARTRALNEKVFSLLETALPVEVAHARTFHPPVGRG